MKRFCSFALLLGLIVSLCACGKVEISMQEIHDANQTEALLKNHQSVYIQDTMDGEVFSEIYLTKDYVYNFIPAEEADWVEFLTDAVGYYKLNGDDMRYVFITPDGVSDFASDHAERRASTSLVAGITDYTIESVSKKDGRITVNAFLGQDILAASTDEFGVTSVKTEYLLDAKTREIISLTSDYTYDDGTAFHVVTEVTYDADAPETVKEFLAYDNQTENLRTITIVSNPGTEKEESESLQVVKGLFIGFQYDDDLVAEFYTDAACTEAYDPYAGADSDLTVYVKWVG